MTGPRFQLAARQFILRFEDLPGLEVVMRPVSVAQLLDMAGLVDGLTSGTVGEPEMEKLFTLFAGRLVSWNVDGEDGEALPVTTAGARALDADVFMAIFTGWFEAMTQAPKASPTPATPLDLPMEAMTR